MEELWNRRSLHSRNKIYIRIINLTNRNVDIIWINFTGEYVTYRKLMNRTFVDINTYETHPWIAIDSETKDRMLIDKQFIYMPKTWQDVRNRYPSAQVSSIPTDVVPRVLVAITIPLYSLRYRTLLEVRSHLKCESDVDTLDLPKELQNDLKLLVAQRDNFPGFSS